MPGDEKHLICQVLSEGRGGVKREEEREQTRHRELTRTVESGGRCFYDQLHADFFGFVFFFMV